DDHDPPARGERVPRRRAGRDRCRRRLRAAALPHPRRVVPLPLDAGADAGRSAAGAAAVGDRRPRRARAHAAARRRGAGGMTRGDDDLAAFYTAGYAVADPDEAAKLGRWRALGARTKAEHAFELCRRARLFPTTLVEIGCGDGALLTELSRLAAVLDGFEPSPTAIELARARRLSG